MTMTRGIASVLLVCFAAGCGSEYTILDRTTLAVSDASRISARNMVPQARKYPTVVEQLGLAEEVYGKQLMLLKSRRNKLRSRRRYLGAFSFGTMAATSLGVGMIAIGSDDSGSSNDLQMGGAAALTGLAIGTILQFTSYMQEAPEAVDDKIRLLDTLYRSMIDQLKAVGEKAMMAPVEGRTEDDIESEMGRVIQTFINQALAINVKG